MLSLRLIARAQKAQIFSGHYQRIATSCNVLSSSDQPSESDDNSKISGKNEVAANKDQPQETIDPDTFANNMLQGKKSQHKVKVGITQKISRKKQNREQEFQAQLSAAAENVGKHFGKRGPSIAEELRRNYVQAQKKREDAQAIPEPRTPSRQRREVEKQPSVAKQLLEMQRKTETETRIKRGPRQQSRQDTERATENLEEQPRLSKQASARNVSETMRGKMGDDQQYMKIKFKSLYNNNLRFPSLLQYSDDISPREPELKTWDMLEKHACELEVKLSPTNIYDEMIQWTLEGKLWKFPIDNEQGMEDERSVHFSEHVFLETHLTDWCPKKGPVRHFMELVCVGLSKNPYMTVDEKVEHIMWYKNYFAEKQPLLESAMEIEEPVPKEISQ